MRRAFAFFCIVFLFSSSSVYAAKLAPSGNVLQPLPVNVQPSISQNVQRSATPSDVQSIQNNQDGGSQSSNIDQQSTDQSAVPATPYAPAAPWGSATILIVFGVVAVCIVGGVWLWRSF
ncbi:MAG: hypothetical protein P4L81_01960 [Candidatus Pacebacteria bacterium]|nr:hypothetical protein [Candidatus Paceibacterota bacterium]